MEKVKLELGEVARISLNRPEKKNALDEQLLIDLRKALDEVKSSNARILILSGEGDTFCAGLDRNLLMNLAKMDEDRFVEAIDLVQGIIYDIRTLKMPVIAAVQRYAIGAGMQLALVADIRIATPKTIFYLREPEFGIIPDMGALHILSRIVGDGLAREIIFTRKQITAEEAKDMGLVNAIHQNLEEGIEEYKKKLLEIPAFVLAEIKHQIEYSWNVDFKRSLEETKEGQLRCIKELKKLYS